MIVKEALVWGKAQLLESESPQLDATLLLEEATKLTAAQQIAREDNAIPPSELSAFQALIARREQGVPIAYLLGRREFYSLDFIVTPDVLIPRPDTELLVELALREIDSIAQAELENYRVLDLGTGSGAIAISIAKNQAKVQVSAVDFSADALVVARNNAAMHGVEHIQFHHGSWFDPLAAQQPFDLIVCNPPYIDPHDPHLTQGDVRFEPLSALVAEDGGLAEYRQILNRAEDFLSDGGLILFEHGCDQSAAVQALLAEAGFSEQIAEQDLAGRDRVAGGRRIGAINNT